MTSRHFRTRAVALLAAAAALLAGALSAAPAQAGKAENAGAAAQRVDVYTGDLSAAQFESLRASGVDQEDVTFARGARAGRVRVEVTMSGAQARGLARRGVDLALKKVNGRTVAQRASLLQENVFRPYSGPGGIHEELLQVAADHADIARAVEIGRTREGKPITAVRVSQGIAKLKDGKRPAMVFQAAQHAREWITPEMVRRLLHHFLDGYGSDAELTKIINTTDLWFIPVVNVDGYDYTFTPGNRLWRKNLADNNGDGAITGQDGIDLNRNFPYKWGYDNEGSSPAFNSETYRGPAAGSEPETQAQIKLFERIRPKYAINWHSAAQLLLYGVGWQTLTSSPDDLIHSAIMGDTDHPAVPGYNPQLGAQLYTTNGETDGHMDENFGTLTQTPEMSTCQTAAASDPDDEWKPENCGTGFEFPDDETLVAREVENNFPYAIAVAKSVHDPQHPFSPVGRTVPDFDVDEFDTSYGDTQQAAAVIRRSLGGKLMHYRINGGDTQDVPVREWTGGERFGTDGNHYFAEYRATVNGQAPGDEVEVWFSAAKQGGGAGRVASDHFTYAVRDDEGADVLVLADEDYKGINPTYPAGTNAPRYAQQYVDAIAADGRGAVVWDTDKDGVPHDLGVLGHFDAVVWYLGDNRLTQDAADAIVPTPFGGFPDSQVADRAKDLVLSVRSYLNEGGKLVYTGETAGYFGPLRGANGGGIYYGLKGHPERPCVVTVSFRDDCELLSDDFLQYYLGSFGRSAMSGTTGFSGEDALAGPEVGLAGTSTNPLNEAGGFQVTSTVLPPAQFPQFSSAEAGEYTGAPGPLEPVEGDWYIAGPHQNGLYRRLTRTVDLTAVSAADQPTLRAQLSYSTETAFDHVIAEVHTEGQQNWTTLPDVNGGTSTNVPAECEQGYFLAQHPWLTHYLTGGNPCLNTGTTGVWNSFTGNSDGWDQVGFDLSAYAGQRVEVSIAYVSDPGTGGNGLFIDDTRLTTTAGVVDAEGFETGLGPWRIEGAPAGSPGNPTEFVRSQALIDLVAAVATDDSVLLGFGAEQVSDANDRGALLGRALDHLLG